MEGGLKFSRLGVNLVIFGLFAMFLLSGCVQQKAATNIDAEKLKTLETFIGPPPASMDELYPPKAAAPIYTIKMIELSTYLDSISVDLQEGDGSNAVKDYDAFKNSYTEVSKMVPELETEYKPGLVDALGKAMQSKDQEKVIQALQQIGESCDECHEEYRTSVWAKYIWRDYSSIELKDPLTQEKIPWKVYMIRLSSNYVGMTSDMMQGQIDSSKRNYQAFNSRFNGLAEGCKACHKSERRYFISEDIKGMIKSLGGALNSEKPNIGDIQKLSQGIGMESCYKCHIIHMPAQYFKKQWEVK
jgi:cytochrome c556